VAYNESLDWGVLRYGNVGISGVNYKPSIPVEEEILAAIEKIMSIESVTEKAIKYMLYAMRTQLFWDGNKRTGLICANKILIQHGKGVLTIPEDQLEEFNERLSAFYESNDYAKIDQFLYEKCLFGIEYS
ncbi:Fic family protein, partial [Bacillus atrophaeus]